MYTELMGVNFIIMKKKETINRLFTSFNQIYKRHYMLPYQILFMSVLKLK